MNGYCCNLCCFCIATCVRVVCNCYMCIALMCACIFVLSGEQLVQALVLLCMVQGYCTRYRIYGATHNNLM